MIREQKRSLPTSQARAQGFVMCRLIGICLIQLISFSHACRANEAREIFFREQVEPVLQKHCYSCHSHGAKQMEGGLTLDWQSGWSKGGDRGVAIVPGSPDESLLIRAVRHADPDLQMPSKKMPDADIAVLVKWVSDGAIDPRTIIPEDASKNSTSWWSLQPLERPAVPDVGAANPIDAFIQAKLKTIGLTPSPPARRRTLIRRLTEDLTGLPPAWEEVQAFESDQRPEAVAELIDRLLASPQYAEHWARHWLDTVHFADTYGFEHDVFRPNAWRYRDYVIDAFAHDLPWSQFVREQLAADVFYPDMSEKIAALGFLGAGPLDLSAQATAPKTFEYVDRDDVVTQTISAFVSSTVHCARCHTHKFDPISQEDYFALQAVFAGMTRGDRNYDAMSETARQRAYWQKIQQAIQQKNAEVLMQPELQAIVESHVGQRSQVVWETVRPDVVLSVEGATLAPQPDGSYVNSGVQPDKETITVTFPSHGKTITGIRLEVLTDPSLPQMGPGRFQFGNFHLSEFELRHFHPGTTVGDAVAMSHASSDVNQDGYIIDHAIDGKTETSWGIHPHVSQPHEAVFELKVPLHTQPGSRLVISLKAWHGSGLVLGRWRLSTTDATGAATIALPADAQAAFTAPAEQRTPEQQLALACAVLRRKAAIELSLLPPLVQVYAATSRPIGPAGEPAIRPIHLFRRGDVNTPAQEVGPGALSLIGSMNGRFTIASDQPEAARRAALAEWIVDPQNPLTWRSIANRVWHYHFGRGISDTPNDFGRMGGMPSHPELLDWMACELRGNGGSIKQLHRLICNSQTYQQSSNDRPEAAAQDSENRMLAHMPRQRLDADQFRDAVMAVSGTLNLQQGGPGIPNYVSRTGVTSTPVLSYDDYDWNTPGSNRRSIYRVVWRGIPDPVMDALDFPDLGQLAPTRGFSISPLQSLVLFNNGFVLHHAEKMQLQLQLQAPSTNEQVALAIRRCWLREATPQEQTTLTQLAQQHGLVTVCRLLLNSSEFLFME